MLLLRPYRHPYSTVLRHALNVLMVSLADSITALDAGRASDPSHLDARRMPDSLRTARERAGTAFCEIARLLRCEVFEAALDRVRDAQTPPAEVAGRYAEAGTLVSWWLDRLGVEPGRRSGSRPGMCLLHILRGQVPADWWRPLGHRN